MPQKKFDEDSLVIDLAADDEVPDLPPRSKFQDSQLSRARAVALQNRRKRLLGKLTERVGLLRQQLGGMDDAGLIKAVEMLTETEARHRTKLENAVLGYKNELNALRQELHSAKNGRQSSRSNVGSIVSAV